MGKLQSYDHLIGQKFYYLTVQEILLVNNQHRLKCVCECGNTVILEPYMFKKGSVKSCGCYKTKLLNKYNKSNPRPAWNKNNNMVKHPLHGTWAQMLSRCENPKHKMYKYYGQKGVKVCDEWHDFWKFVEWSNSIGGRPKGYTLDRIDVNGNYEPSNCRWATNTQQANNTTRNINITYNGETHTLKEWSNILGISYTTLRNRIERWNDIERDFSTPVFDKNHFYKNKCLNGYDKNNNLIYSFRSTSEIPNNLNYSNINNCTRGRNKTAYGLYWKYEED